MMENKIKEVDKMNLELYKEGYQEYHKFLNKVLKTIPADNLIKELKRRKIVGFNWETGKWERKK